MHTIGRPWGRSLAVVATTAFMLALVGCTTSEPSEPTDGSGSGASGLIPAAEGTTQYPLTLETAWGETELAERPQRIATIGTAGTDSELLAALGATPVYAVNPSHWTVEELPNPIEETVEGTYDIHLEAIAASEPDLIVAFDVDLSEQFDQLSSIAPVLASDTTELRTHGWQGNLRSTAAALDLETVAENVIDRNAEFFEEFASRNGDLVSGRTASYLAYTGAERGLGYRSTPGGDVEQFLELLGFDPNPLAENFTATPTVSPENLLLADADFIILTNVGAISESELSTVTALPLWESLEAVKAGHWAQIGTTPTGYTVDGQEHQGNLAAAIAFPGPLSQVWAAEQLEPILQSTLA